MLNDALIQDLKVTLAAGSDAQRLVILSRLTDLFLADASRFTAQQVMLFDELLTDFVASVDMRARADVAVKLAPIANAPAGLIRSLAFDNHIDVARPVLSLSNVLDDHDLVDNARTKSQQHLLAISQRRALSEAVTDVLVTRGNPQVARAVASNANARLSFAGMRTLVRRAEDDDDLTMAMGSRSDMPRQHMLRLLDAASEKVRTRLLAQGGGPAAVLARPAIPPADTNRFDIAMASLDYATARPKVEAMYRAGQLDDAAFLHFVDDKRIAELVVGLSLKCEVRADIVERALLAPTLEILLIVAKLAKLSEAAAKALFQLKAAQLSLTPAAFDEALSKFKRLNVGNAREILGFYGALAR